MRLIISREGLPTMSCVCRMCGEQFKNVQIVFGSPHEPTVPPVICTYYDRFYSEMVYARARGERNEHRPPANTVRYFWGGWWFRLGERLFVPLEKKLSLFGRQQEVVTGTEATQVNMGRERGHAAVLPYFIVHPLGRGLIACIPTRRIHGRLR